MGRWIDTDAAYAALTDYYHHSTDTQHAALNDALSRVPAETVGGGHEKDHVGDSTKMVGDSISRAAAIEAIKEDKIDLTDPNVVAVFKTTGDFEKVETQVMTCDRHIKILKDLPSAQPGWIPVTERLPRPNEEDGNGFYKAYLVQDGRWMDVARWDGKYWIAWGYSTVLLNVVAWMPLPTPYREGGQDERM